MSVAQDRKFKVWVRVQRDKTKETNQAATPNCTHSHCDSCCCFISSTHVHSDSFVAVP